MAPMFGPVLGVFFSSIEEDLGWDRTTIALAFTIGSMTGSLFQVLIGRLLDKYGARMVVVAAGTIIALSMISLSRMQEPWQFWISFGLGRGSALAGIQVGTSVALSNWFLQRRGRVTAIRGVGQRTGQALLPVAIVSIMAIAGWRMAFLSLAGVSALLIILPAALFIRRKPEDLGMTLENLSVQELEDMRQRPSGGGGRFARNVRDVSFTLAEARKTRAFWILLFYFMVDRFALGSINLHMVINFEDKGIAPVLAALTLSIFAATSAATGLPWGLVFERIHVRYGAMIMSFILLLSALVLLVADNFFLAVVFALLFGLAVGAGTIIESLLWADYFGREHLGAIRGFGAPFRLLSPTGPTLTAFLFDRTGSYTLPFSVFAVIFVLMMIAMYFADPPVKPEPEVEQAPES